MAMIVLPLPWAGGRTGVSRAVRCRPRVSVSWCRCRGLRPGRAKAESDPLESVPMRLTYRTSRVLEGVSELAGRGADPSNREIADHAGIHDAGQVSKLLRRSGEPRAVGERWCGAR